MYVISSLITNFTIINLSTTFWGISWHTVAEIKAVVVIAKALEIAVVPVVAAVIVVAILVVQKL